MRERYFRLGACRSCASSCRRGGVDRDARAPTVCAVAACLWHRRPASPGPERRPELILPLAHAGACQPRPIPAVRCPRRRERRERVTQARGAGAEQRAATWVPCGWAYCRRWPGPTSRPTWSSALRSAPSTAPSTAPARRCRRLAALWTRPAPPATIFPLSCSRAQGPARAPLTYHQTDQPAQGRAA